MFLKKIILGSASPRRKQLVEGLDLKCEIRKKEVDEIFPDTLSHYDVPEYLSKLKAEPLKASVLGDEVLLTSDTVVIHKNQILEKPKDFSDAVQMLEKLSNSVNEVVTGVYLYNSTNEISFSVRTKVFFKKLTTEEIEYYVTKYEPYDKAGAYGIQEWIGMVGVEKIEGCFYNVMGLPVNELWKVLNDEFA
ncbi:Maf family nucleotide pyrophosphatase [Brumimicrobium oceani]|uniref:dTTP/UTP pyrophosphatase n=1 Tax=Brumimicrobium oceani TaxID=2100725 RepID=A0A2U2XEG4_9FLAO|nr:Maf family nucleotide pyrophosphatase [Brumimicrobium oceani]PWH86198.1 septum formation protein Maf [Brumimicrobium oceani]